MVIGDGEWSKFYREFEHASTPVIRMIIIDNLIFGNTFRSGVDNCSMFSYYYISLNLVIAKSRSCLICPLFICTWVLCPLFICTWVLVNKISSKQWQMQLLNGTSSSVYHIQIPKLNFENFEVDFITNGRLPISS